MAKGEDLLNIDTSNTEEREQSRKISETCRKIEQEQQEEDTLMLTRLIQVRHHPWT